MLLALIIILSVLFFIMWLFLCSEIYALKKKVKTLNTCFLEQESKTQDALKRLEFQELENEKGEKYYQDLERLLLEAEPSSSQGKREEEKRRQAVEDITSYLESLGDPTLQDAERSDGTSKDQKALWATLRDLKYRDCAETLDTYEEQVLHTLIDNFLLGQDKWKKYDIKGKCYYSVSSPKGLEKHRVFLQYVPAVHGLVLCLQIKEVKEPLWGEGSSLCYDYNCRESGDEDSRDVICSRLYQYLELEGKGFSVKHIAQMTLQGRKSQATPV